MGVDHDLIHCAASTELVSNDQDLGAHQKWIEMQMGHGGM